MDAWKGFIDELNLTENLEEIYFRIRLVIQKEGWSDKDLERPPYNPQDLLSLHHKFMNERDKLLKTMDDYGFEVDLDELVNYLQIRLKKIDEITPLKN